MEIAIQMFNNPMSSKSNLVLHVVDSGGKPLQASRSATDLVKGEPIQAIVGMETWEEAVLVAEAINKAQVPILSFATPSITPPLTSVRFPFLVRMASNDSQQMRCVASIVGSYGWRRVIAIYEDDGYSADSRVLSLLTEELQRVGTEIEHWLAFPQFSTLSDPTNFIHEELEKLNSMQSRVFIIVGCSLELTVHIVTEAKDIGFMGRDSVWITTNSVTDLFHAVNSSVMSSMQGIIGIKTHYPKLTSSFLKFSAEFRRKIKSEYPEEDKFQPGIYALRAHDTITTVALALEKSNIKNLPTTSTTLLRNILSSKFTGLSGKIQLQNMEVSASANYEIVNVVGQSYNVLKFWSAEYGFSDNAISDMSTQERKNLVGDGSKGWSTNVLGGPVYWPGKLDRNPLGWVMPSDAKPLVIGVPGRTSFDKFVKVKNETNPTPTGFCIEVFKEALKLLGYELPHKFVPYYGLYDDMVDQIYLKQFDAVVGDITILSNRSNYVDFTQPYAETGLTMVVPVKTEEQAWLFVKPFTKKLWLVVGIVFVYTMFVVWFLEHRSNPDFRGSWKNQLSTAMWFTFSTLFFAHRENLRSNYTRFVMFVWLFTVFVVTAGYTASLTSMLTIKRLEPTVTDIETLKRNNAHVGCDGDSFIRKYLERVLHFDQKNIINISSQYDYPDAFKNGTIAAAFLERPYERVFLSTYAKDYKDTGLQHRFGGLAFAFPKGSPMARDFSKAFLNLSEDGILNKLDDFWFSSYTPESNDDTSNQSLSLSNFWGLFLVTGLTSTVILLLYIIRLCANFRRRSGLPIDSDESVWKRLGTYYNNDQHQEPNRDQIPPRQRDIEVLISSDGESMSSYSTPRRHPQPTTASSIEMQENHNGDWDNQTRPLRLFNSFPGPDRRISEFNHVSPEWQHIQHSTPL
ncbi:hypothetical protein ACHQM5_002866 [Ranunculus cassubicifolius]